MANTKGARKAARQSQHRRTHNVSLRSSLRTAITRVRKAIQAGDKNKASRHKSRLAAQIKGLV